MITIGQRLCDYAFSTKGWSVTQFAEEIGVSYETIRKWRSGLTAPTRTRAELIGKKLGRSVQWVMHGTDEYLASEASPIIASEATPVEQKIGSALTLLAVQLRGRSRAVRLAIATLLEDIANDPENAEANIAEIEDLLRIGNYNISKT